MNEEHSNPSPAAADSSSTSNSQPSASAGQQQSSNTTASATPSTPKSVASQDVSAKVLDVTKQAWTKAQPILKENGIKALLIGNRATEHFLDRILPPLTQKTIAAIPSDAKNKLNEQKEKVQPTLNKLQPIWEKAVIPFWKNVVTPNWGKLLNVLRQKLPPSLATELTNRFLTLSIFALIFFVYWLWGAITPDRVVAKPKPAPTPVTTRPVSPTPRTTPLAQPKTAPAISPTTPSTPVKVAPKVVPAPSPIASPIPSPSPAPIAVKPEIDLAATQTQLESAIATMGDGIITSVQAPDKFQRLQINLSKDWYTLPKVDQDQLATVLSQQSQTLKFDTFEVRDDQGLLIARSPVVGQNVIILRRSTT